MKLFCVALAWALILSVEHYFTGAEYHYASSMAFSVICMVSVICAYRLKSWLMFCYAMANIFAAVINWLMAEPYWYDALRNIYWYSTVNVSLILNAVELMVFLSGGRDAFVFISRKFNPDSTSSTGAKNLLGGNK